MCKECLEEKHAGVIYGLHLGDYEFRYIGKSIDHQRRFKDHKKLANRSVKHPVYDWMRKYGTENIHMAVIETFTAEDLHYIDEREIFHIAQARTYYPGNLNLSDGGEGSTPSEETRAKISVANIGRTLSEEVRAKISVAQKGRTRSKETRTKMATSKIGNRHPLGYKHTAESLAKRSATRTGKSLNLSEESRHLRRQVARKVSHTRWHRDRNIVKEGCTYCEESAAE